MRNSGKQGRAAESTRSKTKGERDDLADQIDALFRLQLAEFTGARNTLAAQLKKSGRCEDAIRVKALGKPSITAWAVNQLYWTHRAVFDQLIASGERFHKAQAARPAGKVADMRGALDARREALTELSDLATSLLRDAGHNPSLDTIRRVTTTLEALSAYASRSDAPRAGRLTDDVDPPGFELFGQSISGAAMTAFADKRPRVTPSQKSSSLATNPRLKAPPANSERQFEETRKAKLAVAKASLQDAKRSLSAARARAQSLEAAQKKADAEVTKAEKHKRDLEVSLQKAKDAAKAAAQRTQSVSDEVEEARRELKDAERTLEKATKELEKLFGE